MKRNQFFRVRVISSFLLLALVSCMPSPTPTLTPPTTTAISPPPTPQDRTLLVSSTADSGPGALRQVLWRQCFSQADRLPQSFFVICSFEFSAHARSLPSHCHNHSLPDLSDKLLAARYTNLQISLQSSH